MTTTMVDWQNFRGQYAELFHEIDQQYPEFWATLGNFLEEQRRRQYITRGALVREFPTTAEQGTQTREMETPWRWATETQTSSKAFRTTETQTSSIQTPSSTQRTTGTQVEIVTPSWDMAPAQLGVLATIALPRGRGRGLRPLRPEDLMPIRPGGPDLPGERLKPVLPRKAPGPSRPKSPPLRGATRRSLSPGRSPRKSSERGGRSPSRRPRRDQSRGESGHSRSTSRRRTPRSRERRVGRRQASSAGPTRGATVCWNCRATDHKYMDCPLPRDNPYCYGCGRREMTMRTCPDCGSEWRNLGNPTDPNMATWGRGT